jgi:hypothetical protein
MIRRHHENRDENGTIKGATATIVDTDVILTESPP